MIMSLSKSILLSGSVSIILLSFNALLSQSVPLPVSGASSDNTGKLCTGTKQLFHNDTQKCYKEKSKGPCTGENMVFLRIDKLYGDCDCTENGNLPWVYHLETNSCFETFQQAYCPDENWLIFDKDNVPACSLNPCKNEVTDDPKENPIVLFKGTCVQLNAPSKICPNASGDLVKILSTEVTPECVSNLADYSVLKTSSLKCKAGTRRDRNGTCRRIGTMVVSTSTMTTISASSAE